MGRLADGGGGGAHANPFLSLKVPRGERKGEKKSVGFQAYFFFILHSYLYPCGICARGSVSMCVCVCVCVCVTNVCAFLCVYLLSRQGWVFKLFALPVRGGLGC